MRIQPGARQLTRTCRGQRTCQAPAERHDRSLDAREHLATVTRHATLHLIPTHVQNAAVDAVRRCVPAFAARPAETTGSWPARRRATGSRASVRTASSAAGPVSTSPPALLTQMWTSSAQLQACSTIVAEHRLVGQIAHDRVDAPAQAPNVVGHFLQTLAAGAGMDDQTAPARDSSSAMARPIPLEAPVTTAVFPSNRMASVEEEIADMNRLTAPVCYYGVVRRGNS